MKYIKFGAFTISAKFFRPWCDGQVALFKETFDIAKEGNRAIVDAVEGRKRIKH